MPCRLHTLLQQHDICEWANATRCWRNHASHFAHSGKIHISHNTTLRQSINPHINHDRTRTNHVPRDHSWPPYCGNKNIRLTSETTEVSGTTMTDSHGR